jgi:hypothetical protein
MSRLPGKASLVVVVAQLASREKALFASRVRGRALDIRSCFGDSDRHPIMVQVDTLTACVGPIKPPSGALSAAFLDLRTAPDTTTLQRNFI